MAEPRASVATDTLPAGDEAVAFADVVVVDVTLLLLHGYPQTRLMWRAVAPLLTEGLCREGDRHPPELLNASRRLLDDPGTVEAMGEDYRAAATVDVEDDDADRESDRNGSHFLAEDRPEPVADRLLAFLADT